MGQTLPRSAGLPAYAGCTCRLRVSNVTEEIEEVCGECSRVSSPYETKGDFWPPGQACEAGNRAPNARRVFCKSAFFFFLVNTAPFRRGSPAPPYLDSMVTWVYSRILNRKNNQKKKKNP